MGGGGAFPAAPLPQLLNLPTLILIDRACADEVHAAKVSFEDL